MSKLLHCHCLTGVLFSLIFLIFPSAGESRQIKMSESPAPSSIESMAGPIESGLCLYVTSSNSNGPIPNQSDLPKQPRINFPIPPALLNAFDGNDESIPENFYQVLTPNGLPCQARMERRCGDELRQSTSIPASGGQINWGADCWPENVFYSNNCDNVHLSGGSRCVENRDPYFEHVTYRCLDGIYEDYIGYDRQNYQTDEGTRVVYAWDNPNVGQTGTIEIELRTEGGRPTGGELEIKRAGSPHVWRIVPIRGGEEQFACESGEYDVTGYQFAREGGRIDGAFVRNGWHGTKRVTCDEGRTGRYVITLDTAPVLTAPVESDPVTITASPGVDFPQADGQLCDSEDRLLSFNGTVTIRGIDFYHDSSTLVRDGKYTLFGLKRGNYLLRFESTKRDFYAEQVIQIPLKLHTKGAYRDLRVPPTPAGKDLPLFKH